MELNQAPKDALGRPLAEGDGVLLILNGPVLFRVVQIEASFLDPRVPPGIMKLHCLSLVPLQVKAGAKHHEIVRIGTLDDLGPLPYQVKGAV